MRQLLSILTAVVFFAASCNKEHLPEYYFKCKVNGQEYVPDNCANCLTKDMYGDTIMILGASKGNANIGLGIMKHNIKEGIYNLLTNITENNGTGSYDDIIGSPSNIFRTDSLRTGQLNITMLDKTNKIIVGTFYFTAFNPVQNKTVTISEGKFRLQYQPF